MSEPEPEPESINNNELECIFPTIPISTQSSWISRENNIYINYTSKEIDKRRKEEILMYKKNSSNLTKNQQLANIYRGKSPLQRTWGVQNQTITNPNVQNLPKQGNSLIFTTNMPPPNNIPLLRYKKRYKYT